MLTIKKILIPVDFSGTGIKVLEQATLMAKKTNAEIILLTVVTGPFGNAGPDDIRISVYSNKKYEGLIAVEAEKQMNLLKEKLLKEGVRKVTYLIKKAGTPYKEIVSVASKAKVDIILMGTHGVSGFREFVLGSNTFKVVSEAKCPVLSIQKHTKTAGFKNILLPFRDKPHTREKVDYAIGIAKIYGATLHILGVSYDPALAGVKKIPLEAEQIKRIAEKQGVKCTEEVVHGDYVAKLIFNHAKRTKADLIVVMSDLDKMNISEYIIGPVIQQIVNHSKIPVLSIHPIINPETTDNDGADWSF
jgi:nucleotide-binding universal stress UspA family protein